MANKSADRTPSAGQIGGNSATRWRAFVQTMVLSQALILVALAVSSFGAALPQGGTRRVFVLKRCLIAMSASSPRCVAACGDGSWVSVAKPKPILILLHERLGSPHHRPPRVHALAWDLDRMHQCLE